MSVDGDTGGGVRRESSVGRVRIVQAEECALPGADIGRVTQARERALDDDTYDALAETFRALADPTRAKVVFNLMHQELCTCDLAELIGISESAISQHLRVLRQLRLIRSRRRGKQVFHSLDDLHIRILLAVCLGHIRDGDRHRPELARVLALVEQAE